MDRWTDTRIDGPMVDASQARQVMVVPLICLLGGVHAGGGALTAARLGIDLGLPLADSVVLATARHHGATVWTQDADFDGLPDVRYVAHHG
jgi:predicted nucleic acid-binding protein